MLTRRTACIWNHAFVCEEEEVFIPENEQIQPHKLTKDSKETKSRQHKSWGFKILSEAENQLETIPCFLSLPLIPIIAYPHNK